MKCLANVWQVGGKWSLKYIQRLILDLPHKSGHISLPYIAAHQLLLTIKSIDIGSGDPGPGYYLALEANLQSLIWYKYYWKLQVWETGLSVKVSVCMLK